MMELSFRTGRGFGRRVRELSFRMGRGFGCRVMELSCRMGRGFGRRVRELSCGMARAASPKEGFGWRVMELSCRTGRVASPEQGVWLQGDAAEHVRSCGSARGALSLRKAGKCILAPLVTCVWVLSTVGEGLLCCFICLVTRGWVTAGSFPSSGLLPGHGLLGSAADVPGLESSIALAKQTDQPPSPSVTRLGDDGGS